MTTLYGVRVRAENGTLDQMYPVESEQAGHESASRLNLWVRIQSIKHPDTAPALRAEVIDWPLSSDEHATQLADIARMSEQE